MDNEQLDLVDHTDKVIGTIERKDYRQLAGQNLGYVRAAELFLVNDNHEIWIPVRTASKHIAPNGYDYSAAGHVLAGDDYTATIVKEAHEEINLGIDPGTLELICKRRLDDIRYFCSLFVLRTNETPTFNPEDFTEAAWMKPEQLLRRIREGHPAKSDLYDATERLLAYLETHSHPPAHDPG